jgi:tetratricopeptide (TPR) repeat protein
MRLAGLIASTLIAAGGVVPLAAQSATPPLVARETAEGAAAYEARDPAAALRHFETALAADSMSHEANWRAALALIALGMQTPDSVRSPGRDSLYARAERYALRAVRSDTTDAEGWFMLANAMGRTALTKSAGERVQSAAAIRTAALRALQLDPNHDGAYHVLGRWNAEIMRLSGLSRFLARNVLGAHVFGEASWEHAIENLERAVQLDSTRIFHRLDLAMVYIDRKRYADARAQLEAVEQLPVRDVLDPRYKEDALALLRRIADKKDKL